MKYENENMVAAIYTEGEYNNLFIEAMPEMLTPEQFFEKIQSKPERIEKIHTKSREERRRLVMNIYRCFYPMDYMYHIYDLLYRAIITNYLSKSTKEVIRQINAIHDGRSDNLEYTTHSYSGAILGAPGIGKTSTIKRSLSTIPQVIIHSNYKGQKIYEKQITYLIVECPSDCSVKTLAISILAAIDNAIESEYAYALPRSIKEHTTGRLVERVKIACLRHHIGVILIDEIQNAVATASKTKQINPLIKFLVGLTNEACVSVCFCGTLQAEELFNLQEHLKRRTRGFRILPLKADITYRRFLSEIWKYQVTLKKSELNDVIANQIYDYSGGVPAYILTLFAEAQIQAILSGEEQIDVNRIKETAQLLQLDVTRRYPMGTSISDFKVTDSKININETDEDTTDISFSSKKRGRPVVQRSSLDIIEIYKKSKNSDFLMEQLREKKLIEFT